MGASVTIALIGAPPLLVAASMVRVKLKRIQSLLLAVGGAGAAVDPA